MSGKKVKIGLALGSGGWRGLAHIGVLKSLEKNNIPVDYITGSSIGALVGGLYAYYGEVSKIEEIIAGIKYQDLFRVLSDPMADLGLLKGNKFLQFLEVFLKGVKIEQLKIPFKAVATDI